MQSLTPENISKLTTLIWGGIVAEDIFKRWSQGFEWSVSERCALVQHFGGPCAVIAPVQAYLLQKTLFEQTMSEENLPVLKPDLNIENISDSEREKCLVLTLLEILTMMNQASWKICFSITDGSAQLALPRVRVDINKSETSSVETSEEARDENCDKYNLSLPEFHNNLRYRRCSSSVELRNVLSSYLDVFMSPFGVLKFLYSVLLTKGVDNVINELDNPELPLIDSVHGHGSQNLINLLLCGQAVSNVFDGDRDVGGLNLRGIPHSCAVGFLTMLERLRYCTVGNCLKRPKYPVWLLGSETHLSVLFSFECSLVAPDTVLDRANEVFDKYDPEDSGFISAILLDDLLTELDLVNEPEYVQVMRENLDPEDLGVIIRSKFFDEFFSSENKKSIPDKFDVYHYNGLAQSSDDGTVRFRKGTVRHIDWQESSSRASDSAIESCLQLRWPSIWITWHDGHAPSLN